MFALRFIAFMAFLMSQRLGLGRGRICGLGLGHSDPDGAERNILILCLVRRTNEATCKPAEEQQKSPHRPRAAALKIAQQSPDGHSRAAYNIFVSDLVTLNQSSTLDEGACDV